MTQTTVFLISLIIAIAILMVSFLISALTHPTEVKERELIQHDETKGCKMLKQLKSKR